MGGEGRRSGGPRKEMVWLFIVAFGAAAIFLAWTALLRFLAGEPGEGVLWAILGIVAAAAPVGLLLFLPIIGEGEARLAEMERRREANPAEPWKWNPDWDSRHLEFVLGMAPVAIMWVFALFWNAVTILVAWSFFARYGLRANVGHTIFLAVLLLAGVFLAYLAARLTAMNRKYSRSTFEIKAVPAFLGGRLEGAITASVDLPGGKPVLLCLECESRVPMPRTDNVSILWSGRQEVLHSGGRTIPVCFDVPADQPESRFLRDGRGAYITWKLTASLSTPGVDYRCGFEVPVFKVEASGPANEHSPGRPSSG